MKLAQRPRSGVAKTERIGLAWMTTHAGIVWHNGMTGGYASFLGFTANGWCGVVILTNTAVSADDLGFARLDEKAPVTPAYTIVLTSASHRAADQIGSQFW
jgi:hypothetical protein